MVSFQSRLHSFLAISFLTLGSTTAVHAQTPAAPDTLPQVPSPVSAPSVLLPRTTTQTQTTPTPVPSAEPVPTPPKSTNPSWSTPTQDPLLSSRPVPFQVNGAAADAGSYAGNKPLQDLSALTPGKFGNTKYKWYGFVRLDGIFDTSPIPTTDMFVTSAIPIPQGRGQNFSMNPRYSRIGFDTETEIENHEWTLKTRIEMDFFNGNKSGAFGSFPIRLRFAWAEFGPFLVGQAPSVFMDYDVFPNVLDYEGPGGMVLVRQPVFAFHTAINDKTKFTVAVEQPYSDIMWQENGAWVVNPGSGIITTPGVGRNVQDVPDITANIKYTGDFGHLQVAGIARKLTFLPAVGDALNTLGYGVNVTGSLHPWAALDGTPKSGDDSTPLSRSRFMGQYAVGRGINRYVQDVNGLGLDATFDPINGFRGVDTQAWFIAYEHWWAKKWASVLTYGENTSTLVSAVPTNTYKGANYVSGNLIWLPVERMGVGLEYLYGYRQNVNGQKADDTRLQMAFQYRF